MRRIYQYRDREGADQFGRKLRAGIERGDADALAVEAARGGVKDYWGLIAHFAHVIEPSQCVPCSPSPRPMRPPITRFFYT